MSGPDAPKDYADQAVRPFVITGGRVRASRNTIGVDTLLMTAPDPPPLPRAAPREQHALLRICARLHPLVEAAAQLQLPVSVVAIVACDLVDSGHLHARSPIPEAERPSLTMLQELLDGLRKL
ncbi:DUF742 domain-containing protein [Nonomuraea dietziae]|uniref:DUF742 domain-containing protein n=1 Tax=Nonomuraea dietziae TaxID=65515 RepID=A0A7W5VD02_9ACTN|nr:DUF742 domain-containing protein [Nonomuraea dietziae]MBB3733814.1 hypothetical protein [Nonomuraea dietziae]